MKKQILILFGLVISTSIFAQQTWTLDECINYAYTHNITIKQTEISQQVQENNLLQSKLSFLPNLSASASHNYNFGNSIDPTTYEFSPQTTQSNSFSGSANMTLFSGLQKINTVKKNKLDVEASSLDIEAAKAEIALAITTYYLQIMFNKEAITTAKSQLELTEEQRKRTDNLVQAGVLPKGNLLELDAQVARDELQLVMAENALDLSLISLKNILQIDPQNAFDITIPAISQNVEAIDEMTPYAIYNYAEVNQPSIKSAQIKILSAEKSLSISRGSQSPTLTAFGSASSNYFDASQEVIGVENLNFPTIGVLQSDLTPVISTTPTGDPITQKIPFQTQLDNNFSQSVGISLNVPLFSGWQRRTAVKNAKLGIQNAEYNLESNKNRLKEQVYQAYANAKASSKTYTASQKSVEALEKSFEYAQEKYKLGATTALDFLAVKNTLGNSQSELLKAKYDYLFKLKVLDYYMGKPLTFN